MNLFSTRDPEYHRIEKRKVGNAYALPRILDSEQGINECIELFMQRLGERTQNKQAIDLGTWLQYFAFDVVGVRIVALHNHSLALTNNSQEITFATKLGFLSQGQDIDGMMAAIEGMLAYAALCGQVPELHPLLLGNPLFAALMPAMETWNQVLVFTLKAINGRASIKRDGELIYADSEGRDMMSRWAHVRTEDPDKMSTRDVVVHLSGNVFAGSDTTAIALRAVIYFLCRNPRVKAALLDEIDAASAAGKLSTPISYREAASLPYLQSVLKESVRFHSSVGLLMERHVPPQGVEIDGHFLPGGTIVGINPWVTNYNGEVFPEPEVFRPERWMEASEAHLKVMNELWELNFGGGSRKCVGRHISCKCSTSKSLLCGVVVRRMLYADECR